jgi:subtilisin family serine protease
MNMRTLSLLCALILTMTTAAAAERESPAREPREGGRAPRHRILVPQHILSSAEREALAAEGIEVQRELPNGRYLVRLAPAAQPDANDPRIRSLEPLPEKVQPSAYRAAAGSRPYARVKIVFADDVSLDDAVDAITIAGGAPEESLLLDFEPMRMLTARVPPATLERLGGDERVLAVVGAPRRRAVTYTTTEAVVTGVAAVQAAPYGLTGAGVTLSFFEFAPADTTHQEFEGRLTVHFSCSDFPSGSSERTDCNNNDYKSHATHVSGTMIAAGTGNNQAKGMAPKATLHMYAGNAGKWLTDKDTTLKQIGSSADSNSWGYTVGWAQGLGNTNWTWTGDDELLGGYDATLSAPIDKAAIDSNSLFVHAAGNEGNAMGGPAAEPFRHNHYNLDTNEPTTEIYCYSANGSGNDCPVPTCNAGSQFCEVLRHPTHTPWGSINWFASMKNIVAVGAINTSTKLMTAFSSRGPATDGRVKPEIAAPGTGVLSTVPGNLYATSSGTSMASPQVAGAAALLTEQWRRTFNGATPPSVALKALLIAGADDFVQTDNSYALPGPDYSYGFGIMNAKRSVDAIVGDGGTGRRIKIDNIRNGGQFDFPFTVDSTQPVRATLSWLDPEVLLFGDQLAATTLINDLDLRIVDASGNTVFPWVLDKSHPESAATRGVNKVDNNEVVDIALAPPGVYHAIVSGKVPKEPQQFVLVLGGAEFGAAPPPCLDPTEPNDTAETAYGVLATNQAVGARICSSQDVDFFRFAVNAAGTVSVTVTATDTPLRVTVSGGGTAGTPVTVAAGTTQTINGTFGGGSTAQYLVKVEPNGTVGSDGGYTVKATYPFTTAPRRRSGGR